jgi:hypothetical protein
MKQDEKKMVEFEYNNGISHNDEYVACMSKDKDAKFLCKASPAFILFMLNLIDEKTPEVMSDFIERKIMSQVMLNQKTMHS